MIENQSFCFKQPFVETQNLNIWFSYWIWFNSLMFSFIISYFIFVNISWLVLAWRGFNELTASNLFSYFYTFFSTSTRTENTSVESSGSLSLMSYAALPTYVSVYVSFHFYNFHKQVWILNGECEKK